MQITGTHINYYFICHRKLWLFANGIQMENNSELVSEGKLLEQNAYLQRSDKYQELELDGIKIDYYDPSNNIVHEIKHSNKMEQAHEWQVKYYLYRMDRQGIKEAKGLLEYPKLKKRKEVFLKESDIQEIEKLTDHIRQILNPECIPERIKKGLCKNCAYFDFCWVEEDD